MNGTTPSLPETSIITPLYNGQEYFPETRDCVLAQTYRNFEWIIVNDNSDDTTPQLLADLARSEPRVRIITFPENRGPIEARNAAMDVARGRFIAFLDGDDLWLPEKLEKQITFMKAGGAPLSYTAYKKITATGRLKTGLTIQVPERATYRRILQSDSMMASSVVFDREFTGPVRQSPDVPVGKDDFHFFLSILRHCGPGIGLNEDLARLRVHNGSITSHKLRSAKLQWRFYRDTMHLSFPRSAANFAVYAVKGFLKYLL